MLGQEVVQSTSTCGAGLGRQVSPAIGRINLVPHFRHDNGKEAS
jgi:hypothetical protein